MTHEYQSATTPRGERDRSSRPCTAADDLTVEQVALVAVDLVAHRPAGAPVVLLP